MLSNKIDWAALSGQELVDAVEKIANRFGETIQPNPEVVRVASSIIIDTIRNNDARGLVNLDPADVAYHAAQIIVELRKQLSDRK
jgi:hypothetical protein